MSTPFEIRTTDSAPAGARPIPAISLKRLSRYSNPIADTPLDAPVQAQAWTPAA